jgi:hypothetical protein
MTLSPSPDVGPYAEIRATVDDWDANTNIFTKDTLTVRIASDTDRSGITVTLEEDEVSSGIFTKKFTVTPTGTSSSSSRIIKARPGDTLAARYTDAKDAAGAETTSSQTLNVVAVDPVMSFSQEYYLPGERVTITMEDLDANLDPDVANTVILSAVSSTDPVGVSVTLLETDGDSGVFTGSFLAVAEFQEGALQVKVGDDMIVEYKDTYWAGWTSDDSGNTKSFKVSVPVGAAVTYPVPAGAVGFKDAADQDISTGSAGQPVIIETSLSNVGSTSQAFTYIVQVKDSAGLVVSISWLKGTLAAAQSFTAGVSWTPSAVGDYTIEVFVWESLETPTPLSESGTASLTVE